MHYEIRVEEFAERVAARETFLLPLPVLLETGNHVAQIANGSYRRQGAERFCAFVRPALSGQTPFVLTPSPGIPEITSWLDDFVDHAMRKVGLVDRSLIDLLERQKTILRGSRHVYIWSLDHALLVHDTRAG